MSDGLWFGYVLIAVVLFMVAVCAADTRQGWQWRYCIPFIVWITPVAIRAWVQAIVW